MFGSEHPTEEDLSLWRKEPGQIQTPSMEANVTRIQWVGPTYRIWMCFYDGESDELQVDTDRGIEV